MEKVTENSRISFDEMPVALAKMMDDIRSIKRAIVKDSKDEPDESRHIPISMDRACEIIGKSKNTMYRYTSQGRIPHCKKGKTIYFFEDELTEWIKEGRCESLDERVADAEKHIIQLSPKRR